MKEEEEEEFLTMLPHSFRSSVHKKGVKKKSILPVFCTCKRTENGFYFDCTGCKIWFHPECQNMALENISDDPQESTYCTACQAQQVGKEEEDWILSSALVSLCLWSTHTSLNSRDVLRPQANLVFIRHGFLEKLWFLKQIKSPAFQQKRHGL